MDTVNTFLAGVIHGRYVQRFVEENLFSYNKNYRIK